MDPAHLPAFAERFDEVARARLTPDDLVPELRVDLDVPIESVGESLESLVRHFEPFGIGNPSPLFRTKGVQLAAAPRKVGGDGLKLAIDGSQGTLDAIGWGMAAPAPTHPVKAAVRSRRRAAGPNVANVSSPPRRRPRSTWPAGSAAAMVPSSRLSRRASPTRRAGAASAPAVAVVAAAVVVAAVAVAAVAT
jgi:hypothetical protein